MLRQAIFLFLLTISLSSCHKTDGPPNIIFIMSDDHTSQAWGLYGGILEDFAVNTNIKRIAEEGALLENVFCTNSICVPSRASIMTGRYSHQNNVFTLVDSLKVDQPTFTEELQRLDYETAIIGKWHLKEKPKGFDHVSVLPGQGSYHDPVFRNLKNWDKKSEWDRHEGFSSDIIADQSIEWLKSRKKDQAFFMMTHFKATHEPFDYPKRNSALFKNQDLPEPETLWEKEDRAYDGQQLEILGKRYERASIDTSFWAKYPGLPIQFPNENTGERRSRIYQKFIKDFLRSGAAIDENIGRILDYLEDEGLSENTVVIYTSDQGYFLGEHGFFDKRIMYEEALRMPFTIRYPKEIKAGTRIKEMVLNHDFPALFLDYASGESTSFEEGKSFREILKGGKVEDWRTNLYYRYWQHLDIRPAHLGVRNERFKLIYFYGKGLGKKGAMNLETEAFWEFYDLENEPSENTNLINDPNYIDDIKATYEVLIKEKEKAGDNETELEPTFTSN